MSLIPTFPVLIPGIMPPSHETWELAVNVMKWFPVYASAQFITSWYPMGKTAIASRFNIPGKVAWVAMECPTLIVLSYVVNTLPKEVGLANGFHDLPGPNKLMIGLYLLHYLNRAIITPLLLTPSMAPIHAFVCFSAFCFNTLNALQIGGWLGGYGKLTGQEWAGGRVRLQLGLMIFCLGLFSNIMHDDELREVRRRAKWEQQQREKKAEKAKAKGGSGSGAGADGEPPERVYRIPQNLGFNYVLYPHYLSEWIEWAGFWLIGGSGFVPGRSFFINEIIAMMPRALSGKKWYIEKFGKENVGNRKAIIPFIGP